MTTASREYTPADLASFQYPVPSNMEIPAETPFVFQHTSAHLLMGPMILLNPIPASTYYRAWTPFRIGPPVPLDPGVLMTDVIVLDSPVVHPFAIRIYDNGLVLVFDSSGDSVGYRDSEIQSFKLAKAVPIEEEE